MSENRAQSVRIYTDFSADTQSLFSDDIGQAAPEHAVVCIIDNYLSGSNRAKEVIQVILDRNTGHAPKYYRQHFLIQRNV